MKLNKIKAEVLGLMENKYGNYNETERIFATIKTIEDKEIEDNGFMRATDAAAIRKCCNRNQIIVSFRTAGKKTIKRINSGNPCKGHNILTKSIKKNNDGVWTYKAELRMLKRLSGLVGKGKVKPGDVIPELKKVFYLNTETVLLEKAPSKIKIDNIKDANIPFCYTGDYDMHDLYVRGKRVEAGTVDEHSTIDRLNLSMLNIDSVRKDNVGKYANDTGKERHPARTFYSPFAFIRHGAQTSYIDHLLTGSDDKLLENIWLLMRKGGITKEIFMEDSIVKIDNNIILFNADNKAYLLNSYEKVYHAYIKLGMIKTIPFYYFFNDIKEELGAEMHEKYSSYINKLLVDHMK